jgi:hypothetical protein
VHDPQYYRSFLAGTLGERAERRIGFGAEMRKPALIQRTLCEVSGTVRTVEVPSVDEPPTRVGKRTSFMRTCRVPGPQLALQEGLAANLAGGTHHAVCSAVAPTVWLLMVGADPAIEPSPGQHHDFGSGVRAAQDRTSTPHMTADAAAVRSTAVCHQRLGPVSSLYVT